MPEPPPLAAHVDAVETPAGMLVLVHGFGHTELHMAIAGRLIDPGRRFTLVAPRGPIELRTRGAAAWVLPRRRHPEQFVASVVQLAAMVDEQCERHGIDRTAVVLGGFSQGAIVALAVAALPGRPVPAGVLLWCGTIPRDRGTEVDLGRLAGVPVLCEIAARDEVIPPDVMRASAAELRAAGAAVTIEEHDALHEVTLDMLVGARAWLAAL
ncbi:MAG TPA: hypothetical protein VF183_02760 [Acidimicrobiales bacterium]